MKANGQRFLWVLAIWALSATLASGTLPPPYDFSGNWSGTATLRAGGQSGQLSADFAATTNPRKFTGSTMLVAGQQTRVCPFSAKYRKNLVVHSHCQGKPTTVAVAHFDPVALTLKGSFPVGHHGIADFTLQRTP